MYQMDGKLLQQQYKHHISDYKDWNQKEHDSEWMLFEENMGTHLSIDETALSNDELYTIVTNKAAKGRKGALVAIVKGTLADPVEEVLSRLSLKLRKRVQEVTPDMAANMNLIVKRCFPFAHRVIDRFHIQQLAGEAVQEIRIKYRWQAIDESTNASAESFNAKIKAFRALARGVRDIKFFLFRLAKLYA